MVPGLYHNTDIQYEVVLNSRAPLRIMEFGQAEQSEPCHNVNQLTRTTHRDFMGNGYTGLRPVVLQGHEVRFSHKKS